LLEDNSASGTTIEVPLFVAQGLADELARPNVTESFVAQQCAAGAVVDYRTYPGVSHFQVQTVAASAVADWLLDRMHNDSPPTGCTHAPPGP
jgi:Secretory lipase